MYTPDHIADFFLSNISAEKGEPISPLKLQKLVYYAQAWHYTICGVPLFEEGIEAWMNGAVVPSLFRRFARYTKHSAVDIHQQELNFPVFDQKTAQILFEVLSIYGEHSGAYLEQLTHQERPWQEARGILQPYAKSNAVISLESMKSYYSRFLND